MTLRNSEILRDAIAKTNRKPRPPMTIEQQRERARQDAESVEKIGHNNLELSRSIDADRLSA